MGEWCTCCHEDEEKGGREGRANLNLHFENSALPAHIFLLGHHVHADLRSLLTDASYLPPLALLLFLSSAFELLYARLLSFRYKSR